MKYAVYENFMETIKMEAYISLIEELMISHFFKFDTFINHKYPNRVKSTIFYFHFGSFSHFLEKL